MLLPRRSRHDSLSYLLPSLLGLVTVIFLCGEMTITQANAQRYSGPPRYNYDHLPKTSFSCQGRLPGRYYPDPETDCQMFHVCVRMNSRDVQDFKFLCPNGTVFDSEHQVCIDYFQVVCHSEVGTNPLGQIFEIFKLSSGQAHRDLDLGKAGFINPPDSVEKNTLGDDFQVEEYNHNRQASSQNSLGFRSSEPAPSPRPTKSQKAKEDIFFSNKGFIPSNNFNLAPSTTRRTPTTSTTTTTESPSSSTPRRPSLETFESYETESFSGFIPTRNSFNSFNRPREDPSPDFDSSTEDLTTRDDNDRFRNTEVSTTPRPFVFQNTFRTTLSHISSTTRPSAQTFQQQATRFNDEYFTRIPSTTRRPVSKAGFFLHSTTSEDYYTPEYAQSTVNPFASVRRSHTTTTTQRPSTTIRPSVLFQSNSGTVRPKSNVNPTTYKYEQTTTTVAPTTTTSTDLPSTTEYFGRYRQTEDDFETRQTTYSGFIPTTKNSNFFNVDSEKLGKDHGFGGKTSAQRQFPPQLSSQYVEEETLKPRNINGVSNAQNTLSSQPPVVADVRPRDNFGFSTVPPPTTAEPFSTPPPTTAASAVTQQETAQTLAARLQGQLFKKITTKNPEKFAIFFGRSTPSLSNDRLPNPGPTSAISSDRQTSRPRHRVRSTTANPLEQSTTSEPVFDRRGRLSRVHSISSTVAPDQQSTPASSQRPLRRGVRRRIRPGSRPQGKEFDPQLKYTRRRFESARVNNEGGEQRPDEIFNAEASVFRGDPIINNFFQEQRKGATPGSQKSNDKIDQAQQQPGQPENHYERSYGRRVRPNGNGEDAPQNNVNNGEGPRRPPLPPGSTGQIRRRVVKRLRPKNGTVISNPSEGSGQKQFVVTGSTLRPVTRINIKTKLGGKISTTFRTTEITDGSSTPSSTTTTTTSTTTEEPELVTAPEEVVQEKRNRNHQSSSPPSVSTVFPNLFAKKSFTPKNFHNDSHLLIKVISEKPVPPTPSLPSSPLSIKKPILSTPGKKFGKPGVRKIVSKVSSSDDEENQTKSPDYDYAYYNSEDALDYDAETSKLDHKNFGSKPKK